VEWAAAIEPRRAAFQREGQGRMAVFVALTDAYSGAEVRVRADRVDVVWSRRITRGGEKAVVTCVAVGGNRDPLVVAESVEAVVDAIDAAEAGLPNA
jgi:hypothetical protein